MKSASSKRPPDEAHGPRKEAIRPRQLCLEESREGGAPLRIKKIRLISSNIFAFVQSYSQFFLYFFNSGPKLTNFDDFSGFQQFVRTKSKSLRIFSDSQISWDIATNMFEFFRK